MKEIKKLKYKNIQKTSNNLKIGIKKKTKK